MFYNYFKIAVRTLLKNRAFTSINILGLTISLTICLLIIKIIVHIYSTDRFHTDRKQIYRVTAQMYNPFFQNQEFATSSSGLHDEFQSMHGVTDALRIWNKFHDHGKAGGNPIPVSGYFADENFFEFFDFKLKYGDAKSVLTEPNTIVLTDEVAHKLFKGENPVGKTISFKQFGDFTVSGVIENTEYKTHLEFGVVASAITMSTIAAFDPWLEKSFDISEANYTHTYVKLAPGFSPDPIHKHINELLSARPEASEKKMSYHLQRLNDISPGPQLINSLGPVDEKPIMLSIVSLLLIINAGFTYNNLSIAKSISRAKEVGVRKINGAKKGQLFAQFIIEAVLISVVSLVIAGFILDMLTPFIRSLDPGIAAFVRESTRPIVYVYFIAFAIALGMLTGAFPAWYMTRFQPMSIIHGVEKIHKNSRFGFKKGIITFQFFMSLMLLFSIIVLFKQFSHQNKIDLGFNPGRVINVELQGMDYENFRNTISAHSSVEAVSASSLIPATGRSASKTIIYHNDSPDSLLMGFMNVSSNFLTSMEIDLLAGRNFIDQSTGPDRGVIINRKLAELLEYRTPFDAIGNMISFSNEAPRAIIGVSENFIIDDLAMGYAPVVMTVRTEDSKIASIRLKEGADMAAFITFVEKSWADLNPYLPLTYALHTGQIEDYHSYSASIMKFLGLLTGFIVVVALLGLLAMVMYDANTRTKEIGLRKVMGANLPSVLWDLTKSYLYMILIASSLAVPVSWVANLRILQIFDQRVELNPLWFVHGVFLMFFVGGLTTISQTFRAASKNPVETLRYE